MTSDTRRGHHADSPTEIPKAGWIALMKRVFAGISANHLSTISAGVAFFGLFAIFPAIGAVVAIAGLILDPVDVQGTINDLSALLPESAATIISDQVEAVVSESNGALGLATVLALLTIPLVLIWRLSLTKQQHAKRLRSTGKTFKAIGVQLHVSPTTARRWAMA